jgi:hypothetical protein
MTMIEVRIAGIPCLIEVTHYAARVPGRYSGPPEHCYPDEPEEICFEVHDRRGRPAPWLERKVTEYDRAEVERLISADMKRHNDY